MKQQHCGSGVGRTWLSIRFGDTVVFLAVVFLLHAAMPCASLAADAEALLKSKGLNRQKDDRGEVVWVLTREGELEKVLSGKANSAEYKHILEPPKKKKGKEKTQPANNKASKAKADAAEKAGDEKAKDEASEKSAGKKPKKENARPVLLLPMKPVLEQLRAHVMDRKNKKIQAEHEAMMAKWKEKHHHYIMEGTLRSYHNLGERTEVEDFKINIEAPYLKFRQEIVVPIQAAEDQRLAERQAIIDRFSETFIVADHLAAEIHKEYQALKRDPELVAAIGQAGGEMGPSRSFAAMRGRIKKASSESVRLGVQLKQIQFPESLFESELDVEAPSDINPEKKPAEYLEARGFIKRDGVWLLPAEDLLPKLAKRADGYESEVKKARTKIKSRDRKELERGKRALQARKRVSDAEHKAAFSPNGVIWEKYQAWKKKKRGELEIQWKLEDKEAAMNAADDEYAIAWDNRRNFLEKAVEQSIEIAERYGELVEDEKVAAALETLGEDLGPLKEFDVKYTKLKRMLRKASKKRPGS